MLSFISKRFGQFLGVIFCVTVLCFLAVNLGDPVNTLAGPAAADPDFAAEVDKLKSDFNLDDPLPTRYVKWVGGMVTGDFGRSLSTRQPVSTIMREKFPKTILMMVMAQAMALLISVPWAIRAARKANGTFDKASTSASFLLIAMPGFALAPILLYIFTLKLGWFPASFDDSSLFMRLKSLFLPALSLALALSAGYQRLLRTDLGATLQQDFILMAKAKGMSRRRILWVHALRPSLFSLVTVFAINTGALIGGALVVEIVFNVPGMGRELVEAIIRDDFTVILGGVVVISVAFVALNMLADFLYTLIDPRVRQ